MCTFLCFETRNQGMETGVVRPLLPLLTHQQHLCFLPSQPCGLLAKRPLVQREGRIHQETARLR